MSYFFFQQRCNDCEKTWSCSFGTAVVCPECGSPNIETVKPIDESTFILQCVSVPEEVILPILDEEDD